MHGDITVRPLKTCYICNGADFFLFLVRYCEGETVCTVIRKSPTHSLYQASVARWSNSDVIVVSYGAEMGILKRASFPTRIHYKVFF